MVLVITPEIAQVLGLSPQPTHLLNQFDTGLQIKTEINKGPLNSFASIFFLFENEHVVVEELLKLFVDKVNPQLFKRVKVEDFESSNVQDADEVISREALLVKCGITFHDTKERTGLGG